MAKAQEISWYTECAPKVHQCAYLTLQRNFVPLNTMRRHSSGHRMTTLSNSAKAHQPHQNSPLAQDFVEFAIASGVLRFGEFKTKAGRLSPYFFNAGLFDDGAKLGRLAHFYARAVLASEVQFDMLFGPAYKGIPLGAAVAVELARLGRNLPFAYNRKEAKDHGEGGTLVGAPLQGRVLIVDDVMSAGTAARESIALIQAAGATPHAVAIALDRQEMATEKQADGSTQDVPYSAVQYVRQNLGLQVCAIANLDDLLAYLQTQSDDAMGEHRERVQAYRARYGVA
jgi:orotate phosphoribosyltransferase